jgi:hypothetical protein
VKKLLSISIIILTTSLLLFSACAPAITHKTVASALSGSPGDGVNFEVVRISPFYGGVAGGNPWWVFVVYDIERDDIIVRVQDGDIDSTPKEGDFISIPLGKLEKPLVENTTFRVMVTAYKVKHTNAPANWGD